MFRLLLSLFLVVGPSAVVQHRVPPPLEADTCEAAPPNELPNARFKRSGGRTTNADVRYRDGVLTIPDVAEGRNVSEYEKLVLVNTKLMTVVERKTDPLGPRARTFLWEHWRDHKPAYLVLTGSSVDAMSTSHVFVEQDDTGRWRVAWRIVRDVRLRRVDDFSTDYSVEWVIPTGFRQPGKPLPDGQEPDAVKDRLQFRDKCGEFHLF